MRPPLFVVVMALAAGCANSSTVMTNPAPAAPKSSAQVASRAGAAADAPPAGQEQAKPQADDATIPETCSPAGSSGLCLPPPAFAKRLCDSFHPDVALHLLKRGSPWQRGYLRAAVEAWNASGGASAQVKLAFDEEVIIVRHRAPGAGGMIVSGATGSYDVLRWDGGCVTLDAGELTMQAPPRPKAAAVDWKYLSEATQNALLQDPKILDIYKQRRRECKGVTMGEVSKKCVVAHEALSQAIVQYVRDGGALPAPSLK